MFTTATATGKLIISGEHSVVYGYPALAVPLPIEMSISLEVINETKVKKYDSAYLNYIQNICDIFFQKKYSPQISISSQIPPNSGLGSSAALACAYIRSYAKICNFDITPDKLFELVSECEKFAHSHPSGIDAAVAVYEQPLIFTKLKKISWQPKTRSFFPLDKCVIINTGSAKESTKEMIAFVSTHPQRDFILNQIGSVTQTMVATLENDQNSWHLLSKNQRLLEKLGVVGSKANNIIKQIENIGGYAKVCGAGGIKDGSGVLLAYHPQKQNLLNLILKNNWSQIY